MNTKQFRKSAFALVELLIVVVVMAILLALLMPRRARAQAAGQPYQPNYVTTLPGWTGIIVTNGTTSTQAGTNIVAMHQNSGESFVISLQLSGAGTAGVLLQWDGLVDSNNWTTDHPLSTVVTANGTTTVIHWVNFTRDQANNLRSLYPTVCINSNSGTPATINWIKESHGNQ
jgi:hypothetical protein